MPNQPTNPPHSAKSFIATVVTPPYLPYLRRNEPSIENRNILLVAATLIAAVTFQAGVTPPGGIWQDNDNGHVAGRAIYSSQKVPYYIFLSCNTLAFSSSIWLVLSLTFGCPFFLEVLIATISMAGTYTAAIFAVTPDMARQYRLIALVAVLPMIIRPVVSFFHWILKRCGLVKPKIQNRPSGEGETPEPDCA